MSRKYIPKDVEKRILLNSKRRCCLCFYLDDDKSEKKGQIAHVDKNNSNNKEENLVFLCLKHHDAYDSTTSQSKNYTRKEVEEYRKKLYKFYDNEIPNTMDTLDVTIQKFKIGDYVTLNSYRVKMWVTSILENENYECTWISNNSEIQKGIFRSEMLKIYVPPPKYTGGKVI